MISVVHWTDGYYQLVLINIYIINQIHKIFNLLYIVYQKRLKNRLNVCSFVRKIK